MKRALILSALALAACGKLGPLQPVSADRTPPRPLNALVPPTPEQQLIVPTQSAPDRVDDPIKKSRERADDRFDLPPPGSLARH